MLFKFTLTVAIACQAAIVLAVPVESLRVMTYNIWGSGFSAGLPLSHTAGVISAAQADVIALQEAGASVDDIANMLGYDHWRFFNGDLSIISRYPITEVIPAAPGASGARTRGAKIELSPGQEVYLFDVHLEPYPYEPYDIRDGLITTEAQAIASAQSSRGASLAAGLSNASTALSSGLPVFYVGDFNEPSHLDWTQEAADAGLNFNMKVDWPTSNAVVSAGLSDAFRELRPDEVNDQARTWTPGYPAPTVAADEVHDRIDFVYYKAPANVAPVEALTLGYDVNDGFTDIAIQPYPSDHRAAVVEFDLDYPAGDFDDDGDVDGQDFLAWQRGESPDPLSAGDLADWQTNFGAGSLSGVHSVPEPTGWLLLCFAGINNLFIVTRSGRSTFTHFRGPYFPGR